MKAQVIAMDEVVVEGTKIPWSRTHEGEIWDDVSVERRDRHGENRRWERIIKEFRQQKQTRSWSSQDKIAKTGG